MSTFSEGRSKGFQEEWRPKEWKGGLEAMDDVGMPCHRPCPESSKTSQASHTDQHSHLYVSCTFGTCMPDIAVLLLPCSPAASVATAVTSTPGKTLSPAPLSVSSCSSIHQTRLFHGKLIPNTASVKTDAPGVLLAGF